MTPMTGKEIKRTLAALKRNDWSRTAAGRALSITPNAMSNRVAALRGKGHKIPASSGGMRREKVAAVDSTANEIKDLRTKLAAAEKALGMARAKGKKVYTRRPSAGEKEDFVIAIRPDLHGVYQDKNAVRGYLEALRRVKPDMVIDLGDTIDAGAFLAEHHTLGVVNEAAYSFEEDVAMANQFIDAEQEAAGDVPHVSILGNHDMRLEEFCVTTAQRNGSGNIKELAAYLMGKFSPDNVLGLSRRGFKVISRGEMSEGGLEPGTYRYRSCLYTHGNFCGPGSPAKALAEYNSNVVFGHTHWLSGLVRSFSGNSPIGAWTCGNLAQTRRYWRHSAPNGWTHGMGLQVWSKKGHFQHSNIVIHDGVALLFDGANR